MIAVERDGGVATVTIDRQEALNALDPPTLTELRDRLAELADDGGTRAVVLTGAGDRAFVAGADIKAMSAMDIGQAQAWGALGHETASLLETMPKPTIAAVNGFALGGGCELAARVRRALRVERREARPARGLDRDHPGLGRDAAAASGRRHRPREGADHDRQARGRRGGSPHRPRERRLPAGGAAARRRSSSRQTWRRRARSCSRRRNRP